MFARIVFFFLFALCTMSTQAQTRIFIQGNAGISTLGGYDADYLYADQEKPGFFSVRYLPNTTYSIIGGVEVQPDKRSPSLYKFGIGINSVTFRMKFKALDTFNNFTKYNPILWNNTELSGYNSLTVYGNYYYKVQKKFYIGTGLSYDLCVTKFWLGEIGQRYWDHQRRTSLLYKSLVSYNAVGLYRLKHSEFGVNYAISINPLFTPYYFGPKHIKTLQINYSYLF